MNIKINSISGNGLFKGFKVSRRKFGVGSLLIMLIIGGAFTAIGLFAFFTMHIDSSWQRTQGEVTEYSSYRSDGDTKYRPVISYIVDGKTYKVTSSTSSSSKPTIGGFKEVAYNPSQPEQAKVEVGFIKYWVLIFPVVGIILLITAPIQFIRSSKRSSVIQQLMQTGHKLTGVLVDVQSNNHSKNPTYKIVVSATDLSGTVQNYISDELNGIAGLTMSDFHNNPIPIDVYVDPLLPEKYYVDLSDIPNLTPKRITELLAKAATKPQYQSTTTIAPHNPESPAPPQNPVPPVI